MSEQKYWLASTDMGYGHQRAIYPLKHLSDNEILDVANTPKTSDEEKKMWGKSLTLYEFISRTSRLPLVGKFFKFILDRLLYIPKFYPMRDLSEPSVQVNVLARNIKKGLCRGMLEIISEESRPLITSFYAPAVAADIYGFEKVYCIICDTDLNRVWVSSDPLESKIEYFAPTSKSAKRLMQYGVPESKIHITGFPLPKELLGDSSLNVLKHDMAIRLKLLDPEKRFWELQKYNLRKLLGEDIDNVEPNRPLTITYAVGGAGAQKEIGEELAISLKEKLQNNEVRLNLVAGTKENVKKYFEDVKKMLDGNENITILYGENNYEYFDVFNEALHTTDVLWTKPSELSFYCALGIPVVMSPTIGPQEKFNRKWLREIGAGIKQDNPHFADQWLFDLLRRGRLAEAAWSGFTKARKMGSFKIEEVLKTGMLTDEYHPLKR